MPDATVYTFDSYRFDARTGLLTRGGEEVPLTPKAADVLRLLIDRRDGLVTKDDLLEHVWHDTNVSDSTVAFHIRLVRRALGDDADAQRYIRTLHRRGYQFVAPVAILAPERDRRPAGETEVTSAKGPSTATASTHETTQTPAAPAARLQEAPSAGEQTPGMGSRRRFATAAAVLTVLVTILVVLANLTEPPLPRVGGMTSITDDKMANYGELMPFDNARLVVTGIGGRQLLLRPTGGVTVESFAPLQEFRFLDVNANRREALALRRDDPGAEQGLWIVPLDGRQPQRVGGLRVDDAAWSPEGDDIAYTREHSVSVVNRHTQRVTELMKFTGYPGNPVWSPDGRFIRVKVTVRSDRTATTTLWDVYTDKRDPTRVPMPGNLPHGCCGRWLPDRDEYVFIAGEPFREQLWLLRESWDVIRGQRREVVQLTREPGNLSFPVPSTDGNRIYVIKRSLPQLVAYDSEKREFVPYMNGVNGRGLSYSPDGQWVTYIDITGTLWRAKLGGQAEPLTSPPFRVSGAEWSPDGSHLAIRGGTPPSQEKVHIMPSRGGVPQPIDARDIGQGIPSWSHDGRRLTFGDVPEEWSVPTGGERIRIHDLTTRQTEEVPRSNGLWTSRWSPCGRYIAALTADRRQELRIYTLSSGEWRSLNTGHANHLTWSRDSKYIYLDPEGPEQSLRRVRVDDGHVETIVDLSQQSADWAGITPDGTPILTRVVSNVYALELQRR